MSGSFSKGSRSQFWGETLLFGPASFDNKKQGRYALKWSVPVLEGQHH
jgi:hypothetical protein